MNKYLIIPGYKGSDDIHWQTLWQNGPLLNSERIEFEDLTSVKKVDWIKPVLQKLINSEAGPFPSIFVVNKNSEIVYSHIDVTFDKPFSFLEIAVSVYHERQKRFWNDENVVLSKGL